MDMHGDSHVERRRDQSQQGTRDGSIRGLPQWDMKEETACNTLMEGGVACVEEEGMRERCGGLYVTVRG